MLMTIVVARNVHTKKEKATLSIDGESEHLNLDMPDDAQFVSNLQENVTPEVLAFHNRTMIEVYTLEGTGR